MSKVESSGVSSCPIEGDASKEPWQLVAHAVGKIFSSIVHSLKLFFEFFIPLNPVTQCREFHVIPTFIECWLGSALYPSHLEKAGGVITETDPRFGQYVNLVKRIGAELVQRCARPELSFEFEVVNSRDNNAWCLPGGKIAINLGLIQNIENDTKTYGLERAMTLEEKIAAILSHEITHACARHAGRKMEFKLFMLCIVKGMQLGVQKILGKKYDDNAAIAKAKEEYSKLARIQEEKKQMYANVETTFKIAGDLFTSGLGLCASRSHELEADRYGMHLLSKTASKTPIAAIWLQHFFLSSHAHPHTDSFWDKITYFFLTHPPANERLEANKRTWEEIQKGPKAIS